MIQKILQIGNPTLREVSRELSKEEILSNETKTLFQDLIDTLRAQPTGVAISAVQIGQPIQMFVVEIKALPNRPEIKPLGPLGFINPQIIRASKEETSMDEACLSIAQAQLFGSVSRPKEIEIKFSDENGVEKQQKFDGFLARVIQHELDHLNGKLFTDIVDPLSLSNDKEYRKQKSRSSQKSKQT